MSLICVSATYARPSGIALLYWQVFELIDRMSRAILLSKSGAIANRYPKVLEGLGQL